MVRHQLAAAPPMATKKPPPPPFIVMSAAPNTGHTTPALQICASLVHRGFEVIFASTPEFRPAVERAGAEFFESTPFWPPGTQAVRETLAPGLPMLLFDLEKVFIASTPGRADRLRAVLEDLRRRDPSRPVVVVAETMSLAAVPFRWGAPLPRGYARFPPAIGFNVIPLVVSSIDTGPTGMGLSPDSTESGRARNRALQQMLNGGPFASLAGAQRRVLVDECGCTAFGNYTGANPLDVWLTSYDTCFQMCSPSLEFPRSDLHPSIRFAGALPKRALSPDLAYPAWWPEIVANSALPRGSPLRKKVVPVAQGTIATDYTELVLPTLRALAHSNDILVIAILGVKNATLPLSSCALPANARVVDHLPYDAALQHADAFVTNGGYGSLMHGVANGVPVVVAGVTEDKIEVGARAEHSGMGVDLKTQRPDEGQIAGAVAAVLGEPRYRERAVRLMRENRDLDALGIIEREIWRYVDEGEE